MARLWAALATVYVVWGSTYLAIDVASDSVPPLLMLAARFVLAGAILYAVVGRGVRTTPLPENTLVAAAMGMIGGGAVLMVAAVVAGEHVRLGAVTSGSLVALAYLVVFGSLIAYSAYAWLLQRTPASLVATYAYVN